MKVTRKILFYAVVAAVAAALAQPPRQPLKVCDCGASNESDRTSCIGCGASI